ncbi:MAG: nucleoside kinase [Lachnobacterium sp.]|jgi:uridine kinase|nr:nucleoside kinase [Lachnobacterium sp.]
MQEINVVVMLSNGEEESITVNENTTLLELAQRFQDKYSRPIMLAICNGRLRELAKEIKGDSRISFLTMDDKDGRRTYERGVVFLMQKAIDNIWGIKNNKVRVCYSLGQGLYCVFTREEPSKENLEKLKTEMKKVCKQGLPIKKESLKSIEAEELFKKFNMTDKERLLHYRRSSRVNIYDLGGIKDYSYGYMVPNTSFLKYFDLIPYKEGFILQMPGRHSTEIEKFEPYDKLFSVMKASKQWSNMLGFGTIGALNDEISNGHGEDIILVQEALMEERIGKIASEISKDRRKKFIMIAGPSSSGKTSFSHRLSIQLSAKGIIPHPIGLDDYYVDREKTPKDENGNYDFECLEALDIVKFNEDMTALLNGEEVMMPTFNFKTGKREYRGNTLKLAENDVLVIEGIHGLDDRLSHTLPIESKFKIYISALTHLAIDELNPLPTTDGRLIRRIVRDARTRNTSARETIAMWKSVRRGEEKYIFPFQENADIMFNSALVYEIAVLKVYAEPLLFGIPRDCPEYFEAKRLLKLLDYVVPLPADSVNKNSLLREFIGGSCFNV